MLSNASTTFRVPVVSDIDADLVELWSSNGEPRFYINEDGNGITPDQAYKLSLQLAAAVYTAHLVTDPTITPER